MDFYKLVIKEIINETDKAVSLAFEVPQDLKATFKFKAGQYITLKTKLDGEEIRRDYSLCANAHGGEIKVVVKRVESGLFSKFATTQLKVGDVLEVAPPRGRFIFEVDNTNKRTILAFAAGSGITPIMSITKTLLEEEPASRMILVYGNKSSEDTIFLNELLKMREDFGQRFILQLVYSEQHTNDALFGRIDTSTVNYILNKVANVEAFYICGPESMIHSVSDVLQAKGVVEEQIHFELFTVPTETSEVVVGNHQDGNTTVTVMVDDEKSTFIMPQVKTILEAALKMISTHLIRAKVASVVAALLA